VLHSDCHLAGFSFLLCELIGGVSSPSIFSMLNPVQGNKNSRIK